MKNLAFRFVLLCLVALALAGAATRAGEGPAPEAPEAAAPAHWTPRCTAYFANYHQDPSLLPDLAMLVDSCQKGYMTHVIVGLFHCDWRDRSIGKPSGGCISLNGTYLNDLVENPPPGDRLMIATGINHGGVIVGQTLGGRPFMLTPKH